MKLETLIGKPIPGLCNNDKHYFVWSGTNIEDKPLSDLPCECGRLLYGAAIIYCKNAKKDVINNAR